MPVHTIATRLPQLSACDHCGEQIPGLDAERAGQCALALCARCNGGIAVAGGGYGPDWNSETGWADQCGFCGWDETSSDTHAEDCGR